MKNNKGFSLVELIVVIAIMAILAAVAIPTFATFIDKANVASDVSFVNDAEYAAELANAINGTEVKEVYVKVGSDKKADAVYVIIKGTNGGDDVTIMVTDEGAVTPTGNNWAKDLHAALDWDYTFKKVGAGTWKLDTTGKALATTTVTDPVENTPAEEENAGGENAGDETPAT